MGYIGYVGTQRTREVKSQFHVESGASMPQFQIVRS